jgi:5'-3' exonuclease
MKKSINIMNDFVLIATLFGNDFVPKIYSINIKKNFENILLVYASLVSNGQYLVISGKDVNTEYTINYENLVVFLKQVCNIEYKMHRDIFRRDLENNNNKFIDKRFIKDYIKENPIRQQLIDMNKGQLTEYDENIIKMTRKFIDYEDMLGSNIKQEVSFDSYIANYYSSYIGVKTREEINMVNREYLNGLIWTFDFYFNKNDMGYNYKNVSTWFYRYDRAPLLSDITRSLKYFVDKKLMHQFTNNINKTLVKRELFMTRHGQMLYTLPVNEIKTKYNIEGLDKLYDDPYFVDMDKYVDDIWLKKNNMLDCRRISFINKCNMVQVPNHSFSRFINILHKYPNYMNIISKVVNYL